MSVSIDEKVVAMKFDNKQFEKGVSQSIKTIDKLNKSTDLKGAQKGFQQFERTANNMDFTRLQKNVDGLSRRFSAMGIAGMTVIQDITRGAINMGKKLAGVLAAPMNQIKSGGFTRALNLEQAQFQIEGLGKSWNKLVDDINYGVESTAYGLDAAAKVAAQLSASGIEAGEGMKAALRGVSGVAAMTNSSYEEIGQIYTTVAGNGRLMSMQLLQLSSKGINAAATLAEQLGKTEAEIRDMVSKGKIDFATFSKAMDDAFGEHAKDANKTFEGSISNVKAALSKIGALFATPIIQNAIGPINGIREALNAVKAVLEANGGIASQFASLTKQLSKFATLILTDERFIKSITATTQGLVAIFRFLGNVMKPIITGFLQIFPPKSLDRILDAANSFKIFAENLKLSEERQEQLRAITRGVASALSIFVNLLGMVKDLFVAIATSKVGDVFMRLLTFVGNVVTVIGRVVSGFRLLYKSASDTFGGISGIFRNFGTFMQAFGNIIKAAIDSVFNPLNKAGDETESGVNRVLNSLGSLGAALKGLITFVRNVALSIANFVKTAFGPIFNAIKTLVNGVPSELGQMVDNMTNAFKRADKAANDTVIFKVMTIFGNAIKLVISLLAKLGGIVRDVFSGIAKEIGAAGLGSVIEKLINISILLNFNKLITRTQAFMDNIQSLAGTFDGILTETKRSLIAFQRNMQTKRILELAVAIGLLSGALLLLSTLKPEGVANGLTALAGATLVLVMAFGALKSFDKGAKGLGRMSFQLIGLATAVLIMSSALKKLADLKMDQIGHGLLALAGTMAILVAAVKILGMNGKRVMKGALQLILLSQAVKILANVMMSLKDMSWEQIGKGLAGLGGILAELVIFAKIMNRTRVKMTTATAILIIVQAIKQLIPPIKELGGMDLKTLGIGLGAVGVILLEFAAFAAIMSKAGRRMGIFKATALYIIVNAISNIVDVVKQLGNLKVETLVKGIGAIGAVLVELAAFSAVMGHVKGIFIDSVAITILVKALNSLVPVIQSLGSMDITSLAKGIGAIAVGLTAIVSALALAKGALKAAVSLALAAGAINTMAASVRMLAALDIDKLAAGVSALVVTVAALAGAARLLKGASTGAASMILIATALFILAPALAVVGNMPMESMITALIGMAGALTIFVAAGKLAGTCVPGILALSGALAIVGVAFVAFGAGVLLFGMGVNTIIDATVKLKDMAVDVADSFSIFGKGIAQGIISTVKWLSKGATTLATAVAKIVVKIALAIAEKAPELVEAAYKLILGFINGLADGAKKYLPQIMDAIGRLMGSIIDGFMAWFDQFKEMGIAGIGKMIAAVIAVIGLFKLLSASISSIKPANIAGALVMVAAIGAIIAGLMLLSAVPWQNLIAATAAMSLTMIAFSDCMTMISKIKMDIKNIALFMLGAISLAEVAGALALTATQPWQNLLSAAVSITAVFTAYSAVFILLSKMKLNPSMLLNIAAFGLGTLALIPIVMSLKILAAEDYTSILAAAGALTAVMVGYSAVFVIMGALPIPMALTAIANLAIAVAGIAAIIALMGALKQIPGFEWLIGEGGELLIKIGDILGGFVGSIIAGVGKALSSLLPQLGSDLAAFMINATPFFVGMKMVDSSLVDATLSLAGAVLALTGAELISGIASFLGADFSDLGSKLSEFAHGVVDFAEITKDLDGDKVTKAANAAALLAQLAGDMPLEGGLLGAIMGDRMHLDDFGKTLKDLGTGVKDFAAEVKDLDAKAVEGGANAAKLLLELAKEVPLQGGLLGMIMGDRMDLGKFGETLPALGEGLSDFAENVADLDQTSVSKGAMAAQMMINLAKDMPTSGGVLGFIMGNADSLDEFGNRLPTLGSGLKQFADNVKGLDMSAAANATVVGQMLAALANTIPDSGGIKSWFEGDNTLDDFGEQLPPFGEYIKQFSDNVQGIDNGAVTSAAAAIRAIVSMMQTASEKGFDASNITTFGNNIATVGSKYRQFAIDIMASSAESPKKFSDGVEVILDAVKKINKTDTSKTKTFFNNIKGLTDVGVKDITTATKDSIDGALNAIESRLGDFKEKGRNVVERIKAGISSKKNTMKVAAEELATAASKAIDEKYQIFVESGKHVAGGFASGMRDSGAVSNVSRAGAALAKAAIEGLNNEAGIHSDSRKAIKSGKHVAGGFKTGLNNKNKNAEVRNAGANLANSGLQGVQSKDQQFAAAGSNSANNFISNFQQTMSGSGIFDRFGKTNFSIKDVTKKVTGDKKKDDKKKDEKKNKKTNTTASNIAAAANTSSSSSKGSGGGGGGGSSQEKWTEKDAKKALADYRSIVGTFVKDTKDFQKKFLKIGTNKNGLAFVKVTTKYIQSGIKNKSLRTAADTFGSGVAKTINSAIKKKLAKNDATKGLVKKMNQVGRKLSNAKEDKKDAEKIIKSSKSSKKAIAAAKQDLAKANKDIKKYQKQVDKYSIKMSKAANGLAKKETKKQLEEINKQFSKFKKDFNSIEKGLGTSLAKIPTAVGAYIKNSKKASSYAKTTVKAFNKLYGKGGNSAVDNYARRLYETSDQYKQDIKNAKNLAKDHNKNVEKAEKLKNKIKKTSNKSLKKKYADELAQLKKDDKALLKELKKQVTAITKGPAKALKAAKKSLVESYKSFVDISNWEIAPRFDLAGFDTMKENTKAFSIFGDITSGVTKSFDMFSVSMTKSMDSVVEAFDVLNASMDTGMNLMERFTKVGTVEKAALIENADSQLEAYEEFYNGIEELRKKGFDDQLVDDLESQGPQAMNYIRGFLNMNEEEIKGYNDRISKKYDWEAKVLEKNMQKQLTQYQKFNAQIEELAAKGLSEGIINKLKQSGVSQAEYVRAMLRMDQATLSKVSDIYKQSIVSPDIAATAYYEGSDAGVSFLEAIKQSISINDAWDEDIKKLADMGVRPEIINQFKAMGKDQAGGYVASLLQETESGIQEVNSLYDKYISNSTKSFLEAAEEQRDAQLKYQQTMTELRKVAAENGLNPEVLRAIENMGAEDAQAYARSIISNVEDIPKINEIYAESNSSTMDTITNGIISQYEAADEYNADLDAALKNIGKDEKGIYSKYLKDMGMEGAEYVKALANATEEQIAEFRRAIDEREKRNQQERARATMEAFQKQIDAVKNYEKNLRKLVKRGASRELVDSIAKMAESDPLGASEKIQDLLTLPADEFSKLNKDYTKTMKKDIKGMVDDIFADYAAVDTKISKKNEETKSKAKKKSSEVVKEAAESAKNSVKENVETLTQTGAEMGKIVGKAASKETSKQVAKVSVTSVVNKMDSALQDKEVIKKLKSAGKAINNGILNGIAENESIAVDQAKKTAKAIYREYSTRFTEAKGNNLGKRFVLAIRSAFISYHDTVVKAGKSIASDIYDYFANKLTYANGYSFGYNLAYGLAQGLADMYPEVHAKAQAIVDEVERAIRARAAMRSPSRLTRKLGNYLGEGLALGIDDSIYTVGESADELAVTAMNSLQSVIAAVSSDIGNEIDVNPVITPTLDLSRITMQARQLNSMIDNQRIGAVVEATEEQSQNQNGGVVQNFTQNNYSPKALSREELYRQTRNQFALAKEAVRI